jgi:endonuclease/exonuclease/phosphatase family metal-dependent hydrolase
MKRVLRVILIILLVLVIAAGAFLAWLTITEYKPEDTEEVSVVSQGKTKAVSQDSINIVSWNIGYCGLGKNESFVMDGGSGSGKPQSREVMTSYYDGIEKTLATQNADICILQEVDSDADRSYHIDEVTSLQNDLGIAQSAYALNYSCNFVPYPWPPIGEVHAGIQTLTDLKIDEAERISLPCPFKWPLRIANLKRCLLVSRIKLEDTDKELVIVNLHLEAYDDGEGKAAQTAELIDLLEEEYAKGNYVIAGGDFNQSFPGSLDAWPIIDDETWMPGILDESTLPDGWSFASDTETPSCRLLNKPYDPDDQTSQHYVIDGFIISPNVEVTSVKTIDTGFEYSDHNPVRLSVKLD